MGYDSRRVVDCSRWYNAMIAKVFSRYFVCKVSPTPPTPPGPGPTPPTPPTPSYRYVGNPDPNLDDGPEIWVAGVFGFDSIRLSANDTQNLNREGIPAVGSWYSMDSEILRELLQLSKVEGGVKVFCPDFTSKKTGARYRACGVLIAKSSGPLRSMPIVIPDSECRETLRIMFATVEK